MAIEQDFTKLDWTTASDKTACPYVHLQGGRLEGSQLKQSILGAINAAKAGDDSGYITDLYDFQRDTQTTFRLPFFNTTFNSWTNQFADVFSQISQRGTRVWGDEIAGSINSMVASLKGGWETAKEIFSTGLYFGDTKGPPGTYIETPKFWQASNTADPLMVSFVLSNTIQAGGAAKNLAAITNFAKANKAVRHGIKIDYPMVYRLTCPGHRYMTWAYCSSFKVAMLGARKATDASAYKGTIVPEAYSCEFAFTSLTLEDATMLDGHN